MTTAARPNRLDAQLVGLLILTLVLLLPGFNRGLMLYDLGEVTFYAQKLLAGQRPGLDFAVNGYGPGRYLLFAGLFAVFGPSLTILNAVFVALRLVITALALVLGRRLVGPRAAPLAVLPLLLAPGPLHKGFFLAGTLALLWGALRWWDRPDARGAVRFGALVALVALFRMDLGAFGVVLFTVAWGLRSRSPRALGLAWGLPAGALLLGLASHLVWGVDAPRAVVAQVFDDVLKNQGIVWPVFPPPAALLHPRESLDPWLLWLPLPIGLALAWLAWRRRDGRLVLLWVLGLLTLNQVRMKPELGHLLQAGPMLWLALAVVALALGARWGTALYLVVLGLLLVNTLAFHRGDLYTGSFTIRWERTLPLDTRMGRVWLNRGEREELAPLLAWLDDQPPGPLWVPANQPLLLTLAGRPDPSGYVGVVYYADDPPREQELIVRLRTEPPPVAVVVDDSIEGPERTLGRAAPRLYRWMITDYRTVERFGRYQAKRLRSLDKAPPRP